MPEEQPVIQAATHSCRSRSHAFETLEKYPLSCVLWTENGKRMSAIYWNGRRHVQPADKKVRWTNTP
jgi:hypothetical protein